MVNGFYKSNILRWNRLTVGIVTFVIIVIFNFLINASSALYEIFYLKGLFQVIRIVHDYTLGLLPIPSLYIIVPLFFLFFFYEKLRSIKSAILALLSFIIWVINCFYILWGFNYTQPSIYETMKMKPIELDSIYIKNTFIKQTKQVEELAAIASTELDFSDLENEIRPLQESLLDKLDMPTYGRVRIRKLPGGLLLRIRTSGIYIPHAMEGHIDGGSYYKQHPFTLAHEMAHGYGYTDESVCNFIAYLTCLESSNEAIRYSAELAYWRYLARYFGAAYPDKWSKMYKELSPALADDLKEIRNHISRYPDLLPKMKDVIYDSYLKSHGVKAGIKSYDQMIELIAAYNHSIG